MRRWGRFYCLVKNEMRVEKGIESGTNRKREGSIHSRIPTIEMRAVSFSYLWILCYFNDSTTFLNRVTTPFQQWSIHTDQ
jgi:hypothetical protein